MEPDAGIESPIIGRSHYKRLDVGCRDVGVMNR